jgi:integrase
MRLKESYIKSFAPAQKGGDPMANARKLPSGAWQTRPTKIINGRKVSKSFTVHPDECSGDSWSAKSRKAKAQSELLAREWALEVKEDSSGDPTIDRALQNYIEDRAKVLSPRTIYDYKRLLPFYDKVKDIYISDVKSSDIQALVNEWAVSVTAKTIQNRLSLLLSALDYSGCDRKFKLRYPQKRVKKIESPDIEDVQRLLSNAADDFKPVIALAAFGSLRRGEISALKGSDISRDMNTIFVHADIVQTENGFVYKDIPKTSDSVRVVDLPPFIMELLPDVEDPDEYVLKFNPNQISRRYDRLRKKCGIETNFHSLRHFAASFRSDIGIPRKYIEEVGGWSGESAILRNVYDNALTSSRKKYTQMANRFIEDNFENVLKTS